MFINEIGSLWEKPVAGLLVKVQAISLEILEDMFNLHWEGIIGDLFAKNRDGCIVTKLDINKRLSRRGL